MHDWTFDIRFFVFGMYSYAAMGKSSKVTTFNQDLTMVSRWDNGFASLEEVRSGLVYAFFFVFDFGFFFLRQTLSFLTNAQSLGL